VYGPAGAIVCATMSEPLPAGDGHGIPLPAPDCRLVEYVPPRTPYGEILARLSAGVLGAGRAGIDDSFFGLGGYALLAARLAGRIRAVLAAELTMLDVFEAPTVARLAGSTGRRARPALRPMRRPDRERGAAGEGAS
jgi:nonribosomal peptide synthetase DhbF